ncbi:hypothetical protein [Actinokineospora sp. NBRC 105648]|uniref:glycine-rich domain-containing protein n=1 Tax=Actinokineospora sp. NBRC 105648 TaxID=3032206 RepID=UPI0025575D27|nr:hypothetical protein [Actinokineospora sp. NBRC 105648]
MTGDEPVRIVNATLAFLAVCAENPGRNLRPSQRVDLGWHTFILNTRDYAEFCEHLGAGFLHHVPDEFTRPSTTRTAMRAALASTVETLTAAGFEVDADLWATDAGSCSQCHSGCTNCGQGDGDGSFCR